MSSQAQGLTGMKRKKFGQFNGGQQGLQGALSQAEFSSPQPSLPAALTGGNQFNASKKGPQAPLQGTLTKQNLGQQGFLGKGGRVKFDPLTGVKIRRKDRVKPGKFAIQQAGQSQALQDAKDFEFTDLPEGPGQAIESLIGGGQQVVSGGQNLIGAGQGTTNTAVGSLLGTQGALINQSGVEATTRQAALDELRELQRQALSPELDAASRAEFQQRADARRAEVQDIEGGLVDAFQRGRASDLAKLSASGVLDSTTGSNVLAERERRLAQDIFGLNQQANELSRQEQLGERNRIGETASGLAGLQGQQAGTAGSLLSSLLGTEAGVGGTLGSIGQAQGGIAADLIGTGLGAVGTGGQLGLGSRGQEADISLAELGTRLNASQTELANLLGIRDSNLNQKITRQQMAQLEQLLANQGNDKFLGIF